MRQQGRIFTGRNWCAASRPDSSAVMLCGAGEGESTTDLVFPGHNLVCENGSCLSESQRLKRELPIGDLDLGRLTGERRRMTTFIQNEDTDYVCVSFETEVSAKASPICGPASVCS